MPRKRRVSLEKLFARYHFPFRTHAGEHSKYVHLNEVDGAIPALGQITANTQNKLQL